MASKIVSLSYWYNFAGSNQRIPSTRADSDAVFVLFNPLLAQIRTATGSLPLIVTIAGDSTTDAFWSVVPILHDSLPNQTLIVAGSTKQRTHLNITASSGSGSGDGRLVDLYAPGGDVTTEQIRMGNSLKSVTTARRSPRRSSPARLAFCSRSTLA